MQLEEFSLMSAIGCALGTLHRTQHPMSRIPDSNIYFKNVCCV